MSVMLLEMAVYQESDVFAMNPIANVDSAAVSNLEGKEYIRFVWNEISSNQINSKYTLSESILRTIYSHHCVGRNLRKAALLALAEGLNYGKVIASWGEGHNKSQKTGMIGAPIMIDGVKYLLCVTTMRNRNHVIKPYAITLKDANGNNVEEKTVVGNNLVHDSNNGDSTSGNNRLSTITASHHTNTPLSSNAKVQQNIQTNKQNNENIQYYSMNNKVRLTEKQLHSVIKESVHKLLNEISCGGTSKQGNPYDNWDGGFGDNWSDEQWAEYEKKRAEKYKDIPNRDYFNESKGFANKEQSKMMDWKKKRTDAFYDKDGKPISKKYTPRDKDGIPKPIKIKESQLHNIVKESINKVIQEGWFGNDAKYGEKWWNPFSWVNDETKRSMDKAEARRNQRLKDVERKKRQQEQEKERDRLRRETEFRAAERDREQAKWAARHGSGAAHAGESYLGIGHSAYDDMGR